MNEQRIREVFSDEAFVRGLLAMETPEQVQAALREKNVDLSIDEIMKVKRGLEADDKTSDELTDEDLDEVAGGIAVEITAAIIGVVGATVAAGIGLGGSLVGVGATIAHDLSRGRW